MKANYMTPAVTLFQEDGTLDLESQGKLFEHLIANGIDGILVQGSIGEFFAMDLEMRKDLAGFAIRHLLLNLLFCFLKGCKLSTRLLYGLR